MGILDRLMEYKFPILGATSVAIAFLSVAAMGPSLSSVINFFWPLLLSTGFFLAAVAVLLKISPPPPTETVADRAGEELIDYVVSGHQQQQQEGMVLSAEEESENQEKKGEGKPESESAHLPKSCLEVGSKIVGAGN